MSYSFYLIASDVLFEPIPQTSEYISFLVTRKEGNVLFNDALNTFYLWLCCIRHIVKDYLER